ncbi:MAG: hypothetical protein K6F52_05140, partial [Clostridia bacterium]|nr:hypothetical protein [Clostridia bacterium]
MKINSSGIVMQGSSSSATVRASASSAVRTFGNRSDSDASAVRSSRLVSTLSSVDLGNWRAYTPDGRPVQNNSRGPKGTDETVGWEKENLESLLEEAGTEKEKSAKALSVQRTKSDSGIDIGDKYSFRMKMLSSLIEAMFGKGNFKQLHIKDLAGSSLKENGSAQSYGKNGSPASISAVITGKVAMQGNVSFSGNSSENLYRFNVTRTETLATSTSVTFSAAGSVNTADGRSISLNMNFSMSQQVSRSLSVSFERITRDPLIIDFAGNLTQFDGSTMNFDIDADGEDEKIRELKAGSGYLALDANGNGEIDDGSELFGPSTDSGYGELSAFDEDNNGWIDENDSVFSKLKIWYRDEAGNRHLDAIVDKGIGAIYLGYAATQYDMFT